MSKFVLFINLTPLNPLSLKRRGGKFSLTLFSTYSSKGEGEEILERASPLSYLHSPFP